MNVLVAVPASVRGRNIGMTRMFSKAVAVTTIHPQLIHVQIVIVGNWLCWLITDPLGLGCAIISDPRYQAGTDGPPSTPLFLAEGD